MLTYPLLLFHSTTSSVSTAVVTTPKLPSEITGKTVEEVYQFTKLFSNLVFYAIQFYKCMMQPREKEISQCLQLYLNIGNNNICCVGPLCDDQFMWDLCGLMGWVISALGWERFLILILILILCVWQKLFCQPILLFSLFLLLFMSLTALFNTIHRSHCVISANFYLYLQYFQQKVFSFSKISGSQTNSISDIYILMGTSV